uniref:Uncharacterized protein n=1 Tax=Chromera velia CCMP2878 TaxID=1169474 RepID=A0A0G4HEH3_9ALVE|eukprot:Cvel_26772.t1-p1 / transcript=Cvel_26772.t1 / gene=Cvel_26772 / organism=Chromera_velia_CCMP2878 / gene_product=hypothetical protein / transcript_product=hypothetical protein / location=Cvel_scaffold3237:7180-9671(-) / protein_length=742 / sequence_SO=supercontig / SO=protein_coding / is_pseudo=false
MAFLRQRSSHGHTFADCYSCLQKSFRRGDENGAVYWAGQLGRGGPMLASAAVSSSSQKLPSNVKGYPNALRKRLVQNALEDAASLSFASALLSRTPAGADKVTFDHLLPWVIVLCRMKKTHCAAWLNRVAVQKLYEGGLDENQRRGLPTVESMDEVTFAARCLLAHRDGKTDVIEKACGAEALKVYRYANDEVLALHCWQMEKRRPELSGRVWSLPTVATGNFQDVLETRREVPDEFKDKHTAEGKRMGRGYAHFFETMVLHPRVYTQTENAQLSATSASLLSGREQGEEGEVVRPSARGGVEPYEREAKALYLDFRLGGKEARVRHVLELTSRGGKKKGELSFDGPEGREGRSEGAGGDLEGGAAAAGVGSDGIGLIGISGGGKRKRGEGEESQVSRESLAEASAVAAPAAAPSQNFASSPEVIDVDKLEDVQEDREDRRNEDDRVLTDEQVFEIPPGCKALGFKNATAVVRLRVDVEGLRKGSRVFVKIGESSEAVEFAVACAELRSKVGLSAPSTTSTWLGVSRDWGAMAGLANEKWSAGVERRLKSAKCRYARPDGTLPVLIVEEFERGLRVSDAREMISGTGGFELLKVLLFRKFVGCADTNSFNLLVREKGQSNCASAEEGGQGVSIEILSVDENPAGDAQLEKGLSKGLQTAQGFAESLRRAGRQAVIAYRQETAAFIRSLKALSLPACVGGGGRLSKVHAKEPFDEESLQTLSGEGGAEGDAKLNSLGARLLPV